MKQLLALNDWDLFEKAVSLNIPFCLKNEIVYFCGQKLLTRKNINGSTDTRFYGFLFDQEILIKQTLVHDGYSFEEHINNEKNFYPKQYKKILSDTLATFNRKYPNYWSIVKLLIENGAIVQKSDDITTDSECFIKRFTSTTYSLRRCYTI